LEVSGARQVSLDELLAASDFVTLHVPLSSTNRHLIDGAALAKMKKGAILVNTARGPIVDEVALAESLSSGQLGGAGIDVYEDEPRAHPALLAAPNAVLLPHIGSATTEARTAMALACAADIRRVLCGQEPQNALNRVRPAIASPLSRPA
jgi:glyoxylate reductase